MDLSTQFILSALANRRNHIFNKCLVDLILIVVNSHLWTRQVSDVLQHVKWVFECHQEVIHLVQSMFVLHYLSEEVWDVSSVPVQETTSS